MVPPRDFKPRFQSSVPGCVTHSLYVLTEVIQGGLRIKTFVFTENVKANVVAID